MLTHYRPPDNEKRATRLQQLVDSMANMQTDVKNIGENMDAKNTQYRPAINALLKANGMDSVDDVINKAAAEMTDDDRKAFEAVRYRLIHGGLCSAAAVKLLARRADAPFSRSLSRQPSRARR